MHAPFKLFFSLFIFSDYKEIAELDRYEEEGIDDEEQEEIDRENLEMAN